MQTNTFDTQLQVLYHLLQKQGFIDGAASTSLTALDKNLREEIHNTLKAPRFDAKDTSVKDHWNIVCVRTEYYTDVMPVHFEFVFELHYYYGTLQLKRLGVFQAGRRPRYFSCPTPARLPKALHLIARYQLDGSNTAKGVHEDSRRG